MENKHKTVEKQTENKQKNDKLPNKDKTNKQKNVGLANKQKHKKLRRFIQFITNPKLLLCILVAWFITNGWAYILFGIGTYFKVTWMITISSAYLAFLWLPISPEKILTFTIAIELLRLIFPDDIKTLAVLKLSYRKVKNKLKKRTNRKAIIQIMAFVY